MANYVKFQRGSQAAYDALKTAGKLDENTLYFIYAGDNSSVGALYMGNRIISGGDITIASATLDDLADVVISGAGTNSFLVKEGANWVAKELDDVIALIKESFGDVAAPAQVFQGIQANEESAEDAIARLVDTATPVAGDSCILKKAIAAGKYEYTAYVFDGENWAAMDGNYSAENVYFDSDFTFTEKVGTVEIPTTGSTTVAAEGKNIKEFLASLFAARKLPNKTAPAVSLTTSNSASYEVGTKIKPTYTASLSAGSYTYGPATGITAQSWKAELGSETLDTASGTFAEMTVEDATNVSIKVTATYNAGVAPKDNLGSVVTNTEELSKCQIAAGSASKTGGAIKGFRKMFYGSKVAPVELTSATLRAMTSVGSTSSSAKVTVVEGAKQVVIAVPAGRQVTKVADEGAFGTDIFSEFAKQTVSVGGADATNEDIGKYAKDYNVYVYTPATALGANTYTVTIANE